jgi:hypothetical protein
MIAFPVVGERSLDGAVLLVMILDALSERFNVFRRDVG